MTTSERLLIVAGFVTLGIAAALAAAGRPYEPFVVAAVAILALAAFGRTIRRLVISRSGVTVEREPEAVAAVEQVLGRAQPVDLKLAISTGIVMGYAEIQMGTGHVVQLTAVNVSDRPIGVNSIGLRYTNRQWSPFQRSAPYEGNVSIPGILQPQQSATVYNDKAGLAATMTEEDLEIKEIVAHLADGTERTAPVPDDWKRLRSEE